MINHACSFTGHRPIAFFFGYDEKNEMFLSLKKDLLAAIEYMIVKKDCTVFNTGMALGFDIWAAEAVLALKDSKYPNIVLNAYIPTKQPNSNWPKDTKTRYNYILSRCNKVICFADDESYKREYIMRRNRALVDNCNYLIACYNGKSSGTGYTFNYAKNKNIPILNIWKDKYNVSSKY